MSDAKRRVWLGGYVREGKRGPVYVIEKWVAGHHFHLSTRCRTERAALDRLADFEADPWAFEGAVAPPPAPLVMTPELIDEHERWQLAAKKNTPAHVADAGKYLEAWMVELLDRDLAALTVFELKAALATWTTAARHRVIALKGFFRWLRQEKGLLTHAQDPTLDLKVPAFKPAKQSRPRAIPLEHVRKAVEKMEGEPRQVLQLLAATGMHFTEVERFARGDGELFAPTPAQAAEGTLAFLFLHHKSGEGHVVSLTDQAALDAAVAIQGRGGVPAKSWMTRQLAKACSAAGVPCFTVGVMRHSVATWLGMAGKPVPAISELLGHRSPVTTRKFYRDMGHTAVPLHVPSLRLVKSS